jgi:hypothetical protein
VIFQRIHQSQETVQTFRWKLSCSCLLWFHLKSSSLYYLQHYSILELLSYSLIPFKDTSCVKTHNCSQHTQDSSIWADCIIFMTFMNHKHKFKTFPSSQYSQFSTNGPQHRIFYSKDPLTLCPTLNLQYHPVLPATYLEVNFSIQNLRMLYAIELLLFSHSFPTM